MKGDIKRYADGSNERRFVPHLSTTLIVLFDLARTLGNVECISMHVANTHFLEVLAYFSETSDAAAKGEPSCL